MIIITLALEFIGLIYSKEPTVLYKVIKYSERFAVICTQDVYRYFLSEKQDDGYGVFELSSIRRLTQLYDFFSNLIFLVLIQSLLTAITDLHIAQYTCYRGHNILAHHIITKRWWTHSKRI